MKIKMANKQEEQRRETNFHKKQNGTVYVDEHLSFSFYSKMALTDFMHHSFVYYRPVVVVFKDDEQIHSGFGRHSKSFVV